MAVRIATCAACRAQYFPPRLLCARCGSEEFVTTQVRTATIEAVTQLASGNHRNDPVPVHLGSVVTEAGLRIVARLAGPISPGQQARLHMRGRAVLASPA